VTLRDEMLKHSWQEDMVGPHLVRVDDAIDALRQWLADEGLVVVPREATLEMNSASYMLYMREKNNDSAWSGKKNGHLIYAAMIAAVPDALRDEGE